MHGGRHPITMNLLLKKKRTNSKSLLISKSEAWPSPCCRFLKYSVLFFHFHFSPFIRNWSAKIMGGKLFFFFLNSISGHHQKRLKSCFKSLLSWNFHPKFCEQLLNLLIQNKSKLRTFQSLPPPNTKNNKCKHQINPYFLNCFLSYFFNYCFLNFVLIIELYPGNSSWSIIIQHIKLLWADCLPVIVLLHSVALMQICPVMKNWNC